MSTALQAQQPRQAPARIRVDIDVGLGGTSGGGGLRAVPMHFEFGAVAATPLRPLSRGGVVGALGVHAVVPADYGTECLIAPPSSQCAPAYPEFVTLEALAGWESTTRRSVGRTRVLAGPTMFRSNEKSTTLGALGRIDLTVLQVRRVGVAVWMHGALTSITRRDRFRVLAGGISLSF